MKNMEYMIYNANGGFGRLNKLAEQGWDLSNSTKHGFRLDAGDIVLERKKINAAPSNVIGNGDEYVLGEDNIWITVGDKSVRVDHHSVRIYDVGKEDETPLSEIHSCDLS